MEVLIQAHCLVLAYIPIFCCNCLQPSHILGSYKCAAQELKLQILEFDFFKVLPFLKFYFWTQVKFYSYSNKYHYLSNICDY